MSSLEEAGGASPPLPPPERLQQLLFDAARLGRDDMITALLQAGADVEAVDDRGHSALILASYHGHGTTTDLLLSLGAAPDGKDTISGNSALMGVAFKGYDHIAQALITAGADPNRTNRAGQTALMMAAMFGRVSVIDLLLEAGADLHCRDLEGNDAAAIARSQGQAEMAERLSAPERVLRSCGNAAAVGNLSCSSRVITPEPCGPLKVM